VKINGVEFEALIDTASKISVMNREAISKFDKPLAKSEIIIEVVNGQTFQASGEIPCNVEFNDEKHNITLVYIPNFKHDILLGVDWIYAAQPTFD